MSSLLRIYLIRGLIAIAWSVGFAAAHDSLTATSVILLIAYPVIDVVASLFDVREDPGTPARRLQVFNTALSALTAAGLGLAAISGVGAVLFVFGLWAVVSGAAQLTVAIRRRGPELGRQWPMLVAGALSVIAGLTYLPAAVGDDPDLTALIMYTAAGGAFFVIQAATLAWKRRRRTRVAQA
ncbi:DUF308 domain-containing protein [Streptosporangium sp. OZ121]|uniref:DUF308 domain-containing protein n=1 Tax=Streptosporangium sp. OZ121 TaxID=3444183 RepID=UPI003F795746